MRMKNLLLASSALALLGTAGQAQAGTYISVLGGVNMLEDSSGRNVNGPYSALFSSDADTGFVLGGVVGIHLDPWLKGLRAELESTYRRQDVGGFWSLFSPFGSYGAIEANQSTFAILANVWYDFDCGWKIKPYIGGGAGWARSNVNGALLTSSGRDYFSTINTSDNGFAWQAGFGFNYEVQQGVHFGMGYRYFEGPDNEFFFGGKLVGLSTEFTNRNHSVLMHLKVDIN